MRKDRNKRKVEASLAMMKEIVFLEFRMELLEC